MPSNFSQFDKFISEFDNNARGAMQEIAEFGESFFKNNHNFQNDTGSTVGSATGYEIKTGDPQKNFNDPDWVAARAGRKKSRYANSFGNDPHHYRIHTEPLPASEDNPTAVLSVFIPYGEDVENHLVVGGSLINALDTMTSNALPIIKRHLNI